MFCRCAALPRLAPYLVRNNPALLAPTSFCRPLNSPKRVAWEHAFPFSTKLVEELLQEMDLDPGGDEEAILAAFDKQDRNGDGVLDLEEVTWMLASFYRGANPNPTAKARSIMTKLGAKHSNGVIKRPEFVRALKELQNDSSDSD
mmetsp:Transcript_10163/g.19263  ORF Transcript_10163/g.19263 Transcript_10163/m.19263 type:complete len:145 (-) Transcript_10163:78-512(-)